MELAGIPLLSLLDVGHERWEDGHGNFKFGESFKFIDPHPPRPCSVHRIAPMGSGEPYQVTRLSEKNQLLCTAQKFMKTFLSLLLHGVIGLVCDLIGRPLLGPSNITL